VRFLLIVKNFEFLEIFDRVVFFLIFTKKKMGEIFTTSPCTDKTLFFADKKTQSRTKKIFGGQRLSANFGVGLFSSNHFRVDFKKPNFVGYVRFEFRLEKPTFKISDHA
jgi:hypothetical protein